MEPQLRFLDVTAIVVYLGGMLAIAVNFARRNTNTEEYFVGNRGFPGWVIGLSMLGTVVSSSTFLALPAAAYVRNWSQLAVNFALPAVAVVAVVVFIPLFRRGKMTSAFEYLGMRYGTIPRLYGTVSFILMQVIRTSQVLFLVALPVQFLTGASVEVVIIGAGVFVAFYTIIGGIDTVIWTDVIQTVVLIFGGVICLAYVAVALPDGVGQIIDVGRANDKFSLGSLDWDLTERTFWTVLLLGVVNWLAIYGGDQNIVQRYVAAKSTREARKATIIYSMIALPMWALFFFVGTSIFVYYQTFANPTVAQLDADQVLPYFILHQIPPGVAGVLVAAIIAAAMSTLDSSLNAIATVTVVDVLRPYLAPDRSDRFYLWAARGIASVAAAVMIAGALVFANIPKESMNDISLIVTSIFGGCLMGLFMLGFFTTRVDLTSVLIGLSFAVAVNIYLMINALGVLPDAWQMDFHSYWVGVTVNTAFAVVAYGVSLLRRKGQKNLDGLTVWTQGPSAATDRGRIDD